LEVLKRLFHENWKVGLLFAMPKDGFKTR